MKRTNCCRKFAQFVFTLLNMAFFTIGITILSVGIYLHVTDNSLTLITGERILSGATILVITGTITLAVAGFGIIGSIVLNKWLLLMYIILMSIVVGTELASGIVGFVLRNDLSTHVSDSVTLAIMDYSNSSTQSKENEIIDIFQEGFSCCGYSGPSDWLNTTYMNTSSLIVPQTCHCNNSVPEYTLNCNATFSNYPRLYIWNEGCNTVLLNIINEYSIAIGVVATLFAGFQVIGIVLAVCIIVCIWKSNDKKQQMDLIAPS